VIIVAAGVGAFLIVRPGGPATSVTRTGSPSADSRSPDQIAADKATAQSIVLQLVDLPSNWKAKPRSSSSANPDKVAAEQQFASCLGIGSDLISDDSTSPTQAKTDKLFDGNQEITADADIMPSVEAAASELAVLKQPQLKTCLQDLVNALLASALNNPEPGEAVPSGVTVGPIEISDLDLGDLHGDAVALRTSALVTGPRGSLTVFSDLVFALKGRTEITLGCSNRDDPCPIDFELQLANTMIDRAPAA
jgi:hypothetical protein